MTNYGIEELNESTIKFVLGLDEDDIITNVDQQKVMVETATGRLIAVYKNPLVGAVLSGNVCSIISCPSSVLTRQLKRTESWLFTFQDHVKGDVSLVKNLSFSSENTMLETLLINRKSILLDSLLSSLDKINQSYLLESSESVYIFKYLEAKEILGGNNDLGCELLAISFPLLYQESKRRNIDIEECARQTILEYKLFTNRLSELDCLRNDMIQRVKSASIVDELLSIRQWFFKELFGKSDS